MRSRRSLNVVPISPAPEQPPTVELCRTSADTLRAMEAIRHAARLAHELRSSPAALKRGIFGLPRSTGDKVKALLAHLEDAEPLVSRLEAILDQPLVAVLSNPEERDLLQALCGRRQR